MSSIQDLIGKIEKNQKKKPENSKTPRSEQKRKPEKTPVKKIIKKQTPEEIAAAREKFSGQKSNTEEKIPQKKTRGGIKKGVNKNTSAPKKIAPKKREKKKGNSTAKKRFFVTQVCLSKKSCGEKFGPYVWERLCNDYDQDPACESFEIQGFRFERSPCQGACKKSANIRMKEKNAPTHTQFSYLTPLKASKLIKMIKSGASPDNIKRL